MNLRAVELFLTASLFICISAPEVAEVAEVAEVIDLPTVSAKIQGLAVRDDTVPNDERPDVWLHVRRERIIPQLGAGLSDPNPKVAEGCLRILKSAAPSAKVLEALLPIAGDEKNAINAQATLALAAYATDERAARLMAAAWTDQKRFPKLLQRAELALGGGKTAEGIGLLMAVIETDPYEHDSTDAARRLGKIGAEAGEALEKVSKSPKWSAAREAYLALDKIDPKGHGLSADQRQFIESAGRQFKATQDFYRKRQTQLSALDREQLRPLVMQALRSSDSQASRDALGVLTIWRDKQALPEIRRLVEQNPRAIGPAAMEAYLSIDGGAESERLFVERLGAKSGWPESWVQAVLRADIPTERRLELLRRARGALADPYIVPHSLGFYQGDRGELLGPLMEEESNIFTLGYYAEWAAKDKEKRFGKQVVRAVRLLVGATPNAKDGTDFNEAARRILDAAATYELKEVEKDVSSLTGSNNRVVRTAAIAAAARLSGHLDDSFRKLIAALGSDDAGIRNDAREGLLALKLTEDAQRRGIEAALLPLLGQPAEMPAMRLLAKFGGDEAAKALTGVLDDPAMPRALLAAWSLAQIGKPEVRELGLRRLAIYGLFRHQIYQQGSGIDFRVADDLSFHQTTGWLNPGARREQQQAVRFTDELLGTFALTPAEQQFAIRAYRHTLEEGGSDEILPGLIDFPFHSPMDASYAPLLQVVAAEDPHLKPLYIKGQKVADFPQRRSAAEQLARITKRPASYSGLAGEQIDSAQVPHGPYKEQDVLIARYALDRIIKGLPKLAPRTDAEWRQISWRNTYLTRLVERDSGFGDELKQAIRAEIDARGLGDTFGTLRLLESWRKQQ